MVGKLSQFPITFMKMLRDNYDWKCVNLQGQVEGM